MLDSIKLFLETSSLEEIALEEDFSILEKFLILPKNFSLKQEDKKIINKWNLLEVEKDKKLKDFFKNSEPKIKKPTNKNLTQINKTLQEVIEKKNIYFSILEETLEVIKENIQDFINKNENYRPSFLKEFSSINSKIKEALTSDEDALIFHTNTFFDNNKLYELLTKNMIYVLILGNKFNIKKDVLEILFISTLLSEVFYFTNIPKVKTLNQKISIKKLTLKFLKEHVAFAYKKIKKNNYISNSIKNIILLHHEHLDGSGPLELEEEKINPIIHILTITQEFFYLTTGFLENFFTSISPYKANLLLLKNKEKYYEKYFNAFLSLNPLFPLGEIVVLKNHQKAIVIGKSANYKLPLVEVISEENENSIIDLSETMGEVEKPEESLIDSILEDKPLKNKLIEQYKNKKTKKNKKNTFE